MLKSSIYEYCNSEKQKLYEKQKWEIDFSKK